MNSRKPLCLLLAFVFACVLPFVASCSPDVPASESSENDSSAEPVPVESSSEPENSDILIKTKDYSGQTIKVLSAAVNSSYRSELLASDQEGGWPEVLAKAITERTDAVEEEYEITVEEEIMIDAKRYNGTFLTRVRELVYSNLCEYDLLYPCMLDAGTMAAEGLLVNLAGRDDIRIQNSWWSQPLIEDTSILGTYFVTGDIGLRTKNATNCLFFNKAVFDAHNIEYPYQTVLNDKWTLDKMYQIVKDINLSEELDGDGRITYHDKFGVAGQRGNLAALLYASGQRIARIGEDGLPYLSFYSEQSAKVIEDALELMQDKANFVVGDDFFNESPTPMVMLLDSFKADQCAFYMGGMEDALKLGDMQSEFGILPLPKYDETMTGYSNFAGAWSSNVYCIPFGLDADRTSRNCILLDALGGYSVDTVATAYYDVVLQFQKLRTQEDVDMLKIITRRVGADLGSVYGVGGISTMLSELVGKDPGTLKSSYEALESKALSDIQTLVDNFRQHQDSASK